MLSDQPILGSVTASSSLFIPQAPINSLPMHFHDPSFVGMGPLGPQHIDLNSPDMFKNNMHLAQDHVLRIQQLAQNAIEAIERAYHPNSNPLQASGEVIALKHAVETFVDFLRETGVGSLPLIPPDPNAMPTEQQMIDDMTRSVQSLFEKRQRMQENAAGIASLFSPTESRPTVSTRK